MKNKNLSCLYATKIIAPLIFLASILLSVDSSVLAANSVSKPDIQSGLIAYWNMDYMSDKILKDSMGKGSDCDIYNVKTATGQIGDSVEFNGINSYLEARNSSVGNISDAFTIAFWMKPLSWTDQYSGGIISKRKSDSVPGYVIYADGNYPTKMNLRISGTQGGIGMAASKSDVDEDVWQHWAITYDPRIKTLIWYKNGKFDKRYSSVRIGDTVNDTPVQIGHAHTWNGFYDGMLDEVRIYDRSLKASEIKALCGSAGSVPSIPFVPIRWRVIKTIYPTSDIIVAGCTVKDAGAKGDGKTDDTEAFQSAMNTMARAGGGTVFVPEGRYAIKGLLKIPTGVTLRGEWKKPTGKTPAKGSILMAYASRGDIDGKPFIALRQCTGIIGMTIWYPEQKADNIVPYPFCIQQMGSASGTVSNVTLVNAYQGIRTNFGSYLHYIHNVYGSPLAIGLQIDFVSDTGRVDNIHFDPKFWSDSGLPNSPAQNGAHAIWMRKNGVGMLFRRYEWIYSAFSTLSGYNIGMQMINSKTMGETNGQMYKYNISDCNTAVDITNGNFAGISFTECLLSGIDYGIVTRDTFNSRLLMLKCDIKGGKKAALLDGIDDQSVLFRDCSFTNEIERIKGDLVMLGCDITSSGNHINLGKDVNAVTIVGTKFKEAEKIVNNSISGKVKISSDSIEPTKLPDFPPLREKDHKPARSEVYVITSTDGMIKDCTAIIRQKLDIAGKNGGGIVFIEGGTYSVRGRLVIPSGVELRGVYDVEHHSKGKGSVIRVLNGKNDDKAKPFIEMKENSGIRGLTFYYPEQLCGDIQPYPFLIQGQGRDIYVINVTAMNPFKFIDFMTYRCDNHHIEYAAGAPLKTGIMVGGGTKGGIVMNTQFNSNNWAWSPFPDSPGQSLDDMQRGLNPGWIYQYKNLDAFVYGDCDDIIQYQNTVFGSKIGLRFISENGKGASGLVMGHGTDGSMITMAFNGLGAKGIDVINSQLVSMDCPGIEPSADKQYIRCGPELNSTVRMYNSTLWGHPISSVNVNGGTLDMDLSSFHLYGSFISNQGNLNLAGTYLGAMYKDGPEFVVKRGSDVLHTGTLGLILPRVETDESSSAPISLFENHRR